MGNESSDDESDTDSESLFAYFDHDRLEARLFKFEQDRLEPRHCLRCICRGVRGVLRHSVVDLHDALPSSLVVPDSVGPEPTFAWAGWEDVPYCDKSTVQLQPGAECSSSAAINIGKSETTSHCLDDACYSLGSESGTYPDRREGHRRDLSLRFSSYTTPLRMERTSVARQHGDLVVVDALRRPATTQTTRWSSLLSVPWPENTRITATVTTLQPLHDRTIGRRLPHPRNLVRKQ